MSQVGRIAPPLTPEEGPPRRGLKRSMTDACLPPPPAPKEDKRRSKLRRLTRGRRDEQEKLGPAPARFSSKGITQMPSPAACASMPAGELHVDSLAK